MTDIAGGACDDLPRQRANSRVLRIYIFNEVDQTAIGPVRVRALRGVATLATNIVSC
ncbi:MAG TPA: hypothetical protein VIQ54_31380 [Polyangia bacterium]